MNWVDADDDDDGDEIKVNIMQSFAFCFLVPRRCYRKRGNGWRDAIMERKEHVLSYRYDGNDKYYVFSRDISRKGVVITFLMKVVR